MLLILKDKIYLINSAMKLHYKLYLNKLVNYKSKPNTIYDGSYIKFILTSLYKRRYPQHEGTLSKLSPHPVKCAIQSLNNVQYTV